MPHRGSPFPDAAAGCETYNAEICYTNRSFKAICILSFIQKATPRLSGTLTHMSLLCLPFSEKYERAFLL
jgi:hypothetical protein